MNEEMNNIDDLFDDNIGKSLRRIGFVFPKSVSDFEKLEKELEADAQKLPDRLSDPFKFLGKKQFKPIQNNVRELDEYPSKLAQAAREGKGIPEDIRKKMAEDKLKRNQS